VNFEFDRSGNSGRGAIDMKRADRTALLRLDAPAGRAVTGSVRLPELAPAVPWITAQSGPRRHSGSQEGVFMRAYLTAAGMALGLVALWAALVPLLA
jgi:hypothetical protein